MERKTVWDRLYELIVLYIGDPKARIPKLVIAAGIATVTTPGWLPLAYGIAIRFLEVEPVDLGLAYSTSILSGWALILLGAAMWIYQSHSSANPNLPMHSSGSDTTAWLRENVQTAKLSESLPKVVRFAKQIENKELERWARLELFGYSSEGGMTESDTVPEYRSIPGRWMDQWDKMLDLSHYPEVAQTVNEHRARFGVAKLEELAKKTEMQNIADEQVINLLRQHFGIEVIRFCFNPVEVRGVLANIRYRLAEKVLDELLPSGE